MDHLAMNLTGSVHALKKYPYYVGIITTERNVVSSQSLFTTL